MSIPLHYTVIYRQQLKVSINKINTYPSEDDFVQQCRGAGRVTEAMRLIGVRVRRQMRERESKHKHLLA